MSERFPGRGGSRFSGDRPGPDRGPRPPFRPPGDGGGDRPRPPFRPSGDSGDRPRPPFRPPIDPPHSVRLRDGEREIEVQGSQQFVRQILDELPQLLRRLAGETAQGAPASIRMPQPVAAEPVAPAPAPAVVTAKAKANGTSAANGDGDLEAEILTVLRGQKKGLNVAEIRGRLGSAATGQQVRRILERAGSRVSASADRPARYRLR
jgi:hypothetical protein